MSTEFVNEAWHPEVSSEVQNLNEVVDLEAGDMKDVYRSLNEVISIQDSKKPEQKTLTEEIDEFNNYEANAEDVAEIEDELNSATTTTRGRKRTTKK